MNEVFPSYVDDQNAPCHDRNATIKAIKRALQRRSGKAWSVTGGSGSAWAWIKIDAPRARRTWTHRLREGMADRPENYEGFDCGEGGHLITPAEQRELVELLGLNFVAHCQGVHIPASADYRQEYIDRAEGRRPTAVGVPYWD